MLSEFYLHGGGRKRTQETRVLNHGTVSGLPVPGPSADGILDLAARCSRPGRTRAEGDRTPALERGRCRIWGLRPGGCTDAACAQVPRAHPGPRTRPSPFPWPLLLLTCPVWLVFLILGYVLETKSREYPLKCVGPRSQSTASMFICPGRNPARGPSSEAVSESVLGSSGSSVPTFPVSVARTLPTHVDICVLLPGKGAPCHF